MAVDKVIAGSSTGAGADSSFQLADSLQGLVIRSILTKKGNHFWNRDFGSLVHTVKTCTPSSAHLAAQYAQQACEWIVRIGKAIRVTVSGSVDSGNPGRINLVVEVERSAGKSERYSLWYPVV